MRKSAFALAILACVMLIGIAVAKKEGTAIQDGILEYSTGHYLEGEPLETGYDIFGYNYQARMFNENYANAYLGRYGYPPFDGDVDAYLADYPEVESAWYWYPDTTLEMKWNDAWLSNLDRDDDGLLDRHWGYSSYLDSGAWLTNHMVGGEGPDRWTYFVKIVAVSSGDTLVAGVWYDPDGNEIGPEIWGEFAIVQEVSSGEGVTYRSPLGPGLGKDW